MVKKKTLTKKPLPKASKEQIARIDELGEQIYGKLDWEEKDRPAIFGHPMTPNRARQLILQFVHILGGKV